MPANSRCSSKGVVSVTKPLPTMKVLAHRAPTTSNLEGPKRRISQGQASAPRKYPAALAVFMAPARA
jgi:hypothetical protein